MARGKLFKDGVGGVLQDAIANIQAKKDRWAERTIRGFQVNWANWMTYLEPQLRATVASLPQKTASVRENVMNRVVPVAELVQTVSRVYRQQKIAGATTTVPPLPR